ncbi:MAG: hypothetical protein K6E19_07090 [Lachnospiraceae bacterium]|nr:hypothetical protein [Lachnospiraceae bacterium]
MKKKLSFLLVFLLLAGCGGKNVTEPSSATTSVSVSVSESTETTTENNTETSTEASVSNEETSAVTASAETSAVEETAETIPVSFYITNLTGVDIGMVSTLDPITEEQIDLGELNAGKVMIINLQWPVESTQFDMAIYNVAGDLVSVSKVDVTGVTSSVTITLSGDNNLDSVSSTVE